MRTTFGRLFCTIAGLVLLCVLFLGAGFRALMTNYLANEAQSALSKSADSIAGLAEAYGSAGDVTNNWEFRMNVTFAARVSETDTVFCDPNGTVVLCSDETLSCEHLGKPVDPSLSSELLESGKVYGRGSLGLYGSDRYYVAKQVSNGDGIAGFVLVSSPAKEPKQVLEPMFEIFFTTALAVLLAAVATSSILARTQSQQLRSLAAVAHRFGHGDLRARVRAPDSAPVEMAELAAEFNSMADSLERSERLRREFIANVSHELKTPMTTIAGFMDGMLDGTIPEECHRQYMETVASEVRRLSRLVRTMLDVSRLQSQGVPERRKSRIDLAECAGRVLISFEQKINEKGIEVEADLPETGLSAWADGDAITQVIYNLTDNAVKFCPPGGRLWLRAKAEGSEARLTVGNTGPTIPPEELPLIFDRFHKTDKSRSVDREGYGLGLYIVKTIVESHGEDIRATSNDGETEFTFTLPLLK